MVISIMKKTATLKIESKTLSFRKSTHRMSSRKEASKPFRQLGEEFQTERVKMENSK